MPFNGSGTYSAPASSWNPAVDLTTISTTDWNSLLSDFSTAFSTCLTKDGQTTPTANIPLGGFKLTGVGNATTAGDAINFNGPAGTPSSITLTNGTGLPIAGIASLGTGVGAALAINIGSAGAPVLFNGALGTPSSGTLTNCTGLPVSTGISGLGTGIAAALAANTGSAGAPVLFNGAGGTPSSLTLTNATGLPAAGGGTGIASYAVGDILYASGATTLSKLADIATGNALISGGVTTAPSWGKIGLTTHVSGTLPVANGGTNASSAGITAFNNITGYTAAGATGTTSTNLVFSTSPALVTPTLGVASATSINFGGQTLSTYSNGSWTPSISFGGGTTGITYSQQTGTYVKIGKFVIVTCAMILTNKGSSTGAAKITGLPYTTQTGNAQYSFIAPFVSQNLTCTGMPVVYTFTTGSATTLDLATQATSNSTVALLTDAAFANNTTVYFTMVFIATAE